MPGAAEAVERLVKALNAADPVGVRDASTEATWATRADGTRRLYKVVATSALQVATLGNPEEKGDRAVGRVSLWWPAQKRFAGSPWVLLVRVEDQWRVDGIRKDETYAALFLDGRLPGTLSIKDLPDSPDGAAWGKAEANRLRASALRAPDHVVDVWAAPQLARIPEKGPGFDEAHQALRRALGQPSLVAITSARSGEGKTTTAIELARGWGAEGRKVLLVDLDLRMPRLNSRLGVLHGPGVVGALEGVPIERAVQKAEGFDVLVAGRAPDDPVPMLVSAELRALLAEVGKAYDVVVADLATAVQYDDPFLALGALGAPISTIVVVELGRTTGVDLGRARARFERHGRHVVGLVLNRAQRGAEATDEATLARVEFARAIELPEVGRLAVALHTWREGDEQPRERWTYLRRVPDGLEVVGVSVVLTMEGLMQGLLSEPLELGFDHPAKRGADAAARALAEALTKAIEPR